MARPAKDLVDKLLAEVRDPQGMATTRPQALTLVSRCQQQINAMLDDVVVSEAFNVPPFTQIFPISGTFPNAVRILTVRDASGRDIDVFPGLRADYEAEYLDTDWFTATGSELTSWGQIGRDLLMLYPGLRAQVTVTVVYTQLTPVLALENDNTVVPDEDDVVIDDLAALLVRMKSRDFQGLDEDLKRFAESMAALRMARR